MIAKQPLLLNPKKRPPRQSKLNLRKNRIYWVKILPRLIQIDTTQQRRTLLAAGKAFAGAQIDLEGNLRQRRYRFDRVTNWLAATFAKTSKNQADAELA